VISLPTGSGKTGLMMALSFGLKARRVLIINPAEVLRLQTRDKFQELDDLRTAGAIPTLAATSQPRVITVEKELRSNADWQALDRYDLITATTRTTSPGLAPILAPPDDLFDLVLVDEGHHAAAYTWKELIKAFNPTKTRIVLLTGTPYRRDNKPIGAKTIFIYPIAHAIRDRVYDAVSLVTVGNPQPQDRDEQLAVSGHKQLERLRKSTSGKSLLLVKTDRKTHADELGKLYKSKGVELGVVHSNQSHQDNLDAIKMAAAGQSDGLVVVGMLGEGLDVPALKVAVFHRNPQSLPYTLQVIGRLARTKSNLPSGVVVACSNDFSRDTFKLYEGSEDWLKLIPQLERLLVDQIAPRFSEQVEASGAQIEIADIRPHFSVTAFRIVRSPRKTSLKGRVFATHRGEFTIVLDHEVDSNSRVFVTRALETPHWMKRHGQSDVSDERFDVHTFYSGVKKLLIRQSSDESIGDLIQKAFAEEGAGVEPGKLNHVMSSLGGEYLILGLKNGAAIGGAQPSYKMLLGQRVDASVTNTDRANCHAGHCLTRRDDGSGEHFEFRGVAYKNSRVWSLDRDNLRKLGEWMKILAQAIETNGYAKLPQLDGLRQPEPLIEFPGKPIAILPSPTLLDKELTFSNPSTNRIEHLPQWVAGVTQKLTSAASIPDLGAEVIATIDKGRVQFAENGTSGWRVEVFPVDSSSRNYSLTEFAQEYPPVLMFSDGSSWHDGIFTRPPTTPVLNFACLIPQNWKHYDIGKEIPDNPRSGDSIHEFVEDTYILGKSGLVGICDHSTGEVADYVSFDPNAKLVSLYHCKGALIDSRSRKSRPSGVDQKCVEELIAQGMASCRWIRNPRLVEQLRDRIDKKQIASLVSCSRAEFIQMAADLVAPLWRFEIVLVQPGLSAGKTQSHNAGKRVRAMLACAEDYIRGCGGTLKVICS